MEGFVLSIPALICFIVGLALIIVEVLTPGIGVPGAAGLLFFIAAVILQAQNITQALIMIIIMLVIVIAALVIIVKRGGNGKIKAKGVILGESINQEGNDFEKLAGKTGITNTPLRPAGTVTIDGNRYDVVTEHGFVAEGVEVKVIKTDGLRIVVAPVD